MEDQKARHRPAAGVYVYKRKRPSGDRWVVEHRRGAGQPKSYKLFVTRTEAEAFASELRVTVRAASEVHGEAMTVEEAWHRYAARAVVRLRPGALETYTGAMTKHVLPAIGDVHVVDIDVRLVRKLVDDLLAAGSAPKTVRNTIGVLRSVLAMLIEEKILVSNPASIQKGWLPTRIPEPKSLSLSQLQDFLAAADQEPRRKLINFLAMTGVRLGEALALRWQDVDLETGLAVIRRSVRMKQESQPKTRFGLRAVDLAPQIVNQLRFENHNGELVFPNDRGTFLSARDIHHVFRRVSRRAGLPLIHPHMLRHTWATLQLNSGTPLNYVSRALGHHSTAFTAGVYATAQPEPRREDVSRFAAAALRQPASPVPVRESDEARGADAGAAADADAPKLATGDEVSDRTN